MKTLLCTLSAIASFLTLRAIEPPKLIVNIVVSSMRAEDPDRYAANLSDRGFRRLLEGGSSYAESHYNYLHTTTPVSLATLTTGANPSIHGIIAPRWIDYVTNEPVDLIADRKTLGHGCDAGTGNYSPRNLVAPTLGESLQESSPGSRVVTLALEPQSAVVMGGLTRDVYWLDADHANWTSSSFYAEALPDWIVRYNKSSELLDHILYFWEPTLDRNSYVNARHGRESSDSPAQLQGKCKEDKRTPGLANFPVPTSLADRIRRTPAGNTIVLEFAKRAIAELQLGQDDRPDLLNICLDAPRLLAEEFGPESMPVEDMYYRLDKDLAAFLDYLFAQVKPEKTIVVLTSDHGTSPSYDAGIVERDRFNAQQFRVIVNSFLSAQHGPGDWVLDYVEGNLYLNHTLIFNKGMNLAQIQDQTATFAMQFRGVSHALSATAMRASYFGSGYGEKMQNSFYPRRSGDVIVNLMPGWIEERDGYRSASGSMYGYDTNVPLVFYGSGIPARRIGRKTEMTAVAPTLAYLLGIPEPAASEGAVLEEFRQ